MKRTGKVMQRSGSSPDNPKVYSALPRADNVMLVAATHDLASSLETLMKQVYFGKVQFKSQDASIYQETWSHQRSCSGRVLPRERLLAGSFPM